MPPPEPDEDNGADGFPLTDLVEADEADLLIEDLGSDADLGGKLDDEQPLMSLEEARSKLPPSLQAAFEEQLRGRYREVVRYHGKTS